jgi:hypothetical protein
VNKGAHLDDLEVDGKVILNAYFKKYNGSVYWVNLA